jgi:hypothetical protein
MTVNSRPLYRLSYRGAILNGAGTIVGIRVSGRNQVTHILYAGKRARNQLGVAGGALSCTSAIARTVSTM